MSGWPGEEQPRGVFGRAGDGEGVAAGHPLTAVTMQPSSFLTLVNPVRSSRSCPCPLPVCPNSTARVIF